jgi:hypothetical protein
LDAFVEDFKASELTLHEFFSEVNKQGAPTRETLTATF